MGYKSNYGLISINGVIPFSPLQDIVGNISKFVMDMCILTTYLQKHDWYDLTSTQNSKFAKY